MFQDYVDVETTYARLYEGELPKAYDHAHHVSRIQCSKYRPVYWYTNRYIVFRKKRDRMLIFFIAIRF